MLKLYTVVVIALLAPAISFGEIKMMESKMISGKNLSSSITTICIDGYKFIAVGYNSSGRNESRTAAVHQVYEEKGGKTVPAKCK